MDKFVTTPSSSDVDLLIEKFRLELGNQGNDDDGNTRRLTITSTFQPEEGNAQDFDSQINELENLIKTLQNEISEMSKNADREVEYTLPVLVSNSYKIHSRGSSATIILEDTKDSDALRKKMMKEDLFETEQFSQIFPLMIRDVMLPLENGFTLLNTPSEKTNVVNEMNEGNVSTRYVDIWNDLPTPEDNLDGLLCELQAEITEKIETLKDIILEESSSSPDLKFEDA